MMLKQQTVESEHAVKRSGRPVTMSDVCFQLTKEMQKPTEKKQNSAACRSSLEQPGDTMG